MPRLLGSMLLLLAPCFTHASGAYFEVKYPPSTEAGKLQFGVTYTVWIPEGVKQLRGVIVHQHGCGSGACKGGETAAYDLHWQALAKKWDCALLGPSYQQEDKQNCRLWCDPRNGSEEAFLTGLKDLAKQSNHPELATVPWCLWGHSGGGFWASLMQTKYPERIVAIWFRSGTAFTSWEKGEIPKPEISQAVYGVPMMMNPGGKEKDDKRFSGAWTGSFAMFQAYRAKGAPVGFAPDPRTSHECGDSRYLAIPFFDACLKIRLPKNAGEPLRSVDQSSSYLADALSSEIKAAKEYKGKVNEAVWLPDEATAKAWAEYVQKGSTSDTTPPAKPFSIKNVDLQLSWDAEADFESGLSGFIIEKDGKEVGKVPAKPAGPFGRPLFQKMSYHDTPEKPLAEMKFKINGPGKYSIRSVNSVGLTSEPEVIEVKK
jgi:hypothetical protein